jgi:hypothetical protein
MWQRECLAPKTLIPRRRLHRIRGRYAALSTLVRRAYIQRRTGTGQLLFPFSKYAPVTTRFPVHKPATIKLTHYRKFGKLSRDLSYPAGPRFPPLVGCLVRPRDGPNAEPSQQDVYRDVADQLRRASPKWNSGPSRPRMRPLTQSLPYCLTKRAERSQG